MMCLRLCTASVAVLLLVQGVSAKVPVPENGAYHSAYTQYDENYGQGKATEDFIDQSGKSLAIEMEFYDWDATRGFPENRFNRMRNQFGATPHMTLEPHDFNSDQTYSNQDIADGVYNDDIDALAHSIDNWGHDLMLRFGHEMNGNWYPWSGAQSGGEGVGPDRYKAAFRKMHDRFEKAGVNNQVSWVWAPNHQSIPNESWNAPENYYPGDEYVDWIGLDGYNFGRNGSGGSRSFDEVFSGIYDKFDDYDKPMMIAESASAPDGGSKDEWIADAYDDLESDYPLIKAMTWFNQNKEKDFRINSSQAVLNAYQNAVGDDYFISEVVTPEPASATLLLAGGTMLLLGRRARSGAVL